MASHPLSGLSSRDQGVEGALVLCGASRCVEPGLLIQRRDGSLKGFQRTWITKIVYTGNSGCQRQ